MNNAQLTLLTSPDPAEAGSPPSPAHGAPAQGGDNSPVPKNTWQQSFSGIFFYRYKEVTGEICKLGFGALKAMLNQHAQKYWVDPDTGAPEIPSVEAFTEEVNAFFQDEFAATERGFHFSYLLKQFGSFKKHKPEKREAESDGWLTYICANPECKHEMRHLRSRWLQHKDQNGICSKCRTKFPVNNVLNKIPTLKDYLPTNQERTS
ncbi:MAG: hypothetical protein HYV29_01705 [Ignavibacteriales bacterium]|nr:hypothetical protein [Ignavibacteriales bacterium]